MCIFCRPFHLQPWRLAGDMSHFKQVTMEPPFPEMQNAVIMGRKTWESIPSKFRPLKGRTNVVLTTSKPRSDFPDDIIVASSLQDATTQLEKLDDLGYVFVIGGAKVYQESLESGLVNRVIYTQVSNVPEETKFDAFFPQLADADWDCRPFQSLDKENSGECGKIHTDKSGMTFQFLEYTKKTRQPTSIPEEGPEVNPEEMQYLDLCREIIESGVSKTENVCMLSYCITNGICILLIYNRLPAFHTDSTRRPNWHWNLIQIWYSNALLAS